MKKTKITPHRTLIPSAEQAPPTKSLPLSTYQSERKTAGDSLPASPPLPALAMLSGKGGGFRGEELRRCCVCFLFRVSGFIMLLNIHQLACALTLLS